MNKRKYMILVVTMMAALSFNACGEVASTLDNGVNATANTTVNATDTIVENTSENTTVLETEVKETESTKVQEESTFTDIIAYRDVYGTTIGFEYPVGYYFNQVELEVSGVIRAFEGELENAKTVVTDENYRATATVDLYDLDGNKVGYFKEKKYPQIECYNDEWCIIKCFDGHFMLKTAELDAVLKNASLIEKEELPIEVVQAEVVQPEAVQPETPQPQVSQPQRNYPSGNYTPGSIYGPKLSQTELDQVADVVQAYMNSYDFSSMSDYQKVETAHDYLSDVCEYAPDWRLNQANTAWGALVYGEAQCSGYARAMKALCDAMGIGCYYVHADEYASNPSHQWNVVCVDGGWYIIDVQGNDKNNFRVAYLVSDDTYVNTTGMSWDRSQAPACTDNYGAYDLDTLTEEDVFEDSDENVYFQFGDAWITFN